MRRSLSLVCVLLAGCASTSTRRPAEPAAGQHGAGTFEAPISRCGPRDSYTYVAREFVCKDGKNPLAGQIDEAARVRLGGKKHPGGHIVDLYKVPCAGGDEIVYVDMYGCPGQQDQPSDQPLPEVEAATEALDHGKFEVAGRTCIAALERDTSGMRASDCVGMIPATIALAGDEAGAQKMVGAFCGRLGGASAHRMRVEYVKEVSRWYFRGRKGRLSREEFMALVGRFASACGVNDDQGA